MIIKLVRHGQSEMNLDNNRENSHLVGDHTIRLTKYGQEQSRRVGETIGQDFIIGSLIYRSPYLRARETLDHILEGAGVFDDTVKIYEDPRLREVDHGYDVRKPQEELRQKYGWFYYRFKGGESPADCYDRICTFLESMTRQVKKRKPENVLIVTHGFTIRCFVMRFLHLTVEEYEKIKNPKNCDIVIIEKIEKDRDYQFTTRNWGVSGLHLYP